jgi:uncharacterized protein YjlB
MSRMDRRKFAASLVAASLGSSHALASNAGNSSPSIPQQLHLKPNGWMPNSPLPVLLYRSALPSSADLAAEMERVFIANKWPPQWRNGVYSFHHYHSTAHEVLGFAAGYADLMLGGQGGETVTVHAGDVLVLPTGTGHCRIAASDDFLVIGAYPENEQWDICRSAATPETLASMRKVRFPQSDPLTGPTGALPELWI